MPETWPESVPYEPQNGSVSGMPFREPHRTDMEDGEQRARRSTTKNIATLKFTIHMSNAQFEIFKAWVRDDLVDGTLKFTMNVWTGSAETSKTCRFVERYSDDPVIGDYHRIGVTIDVEDY